MHTGVVVIDAGDVVGRRAQRGGPAAGARRPGRRADQRGDARAGRAATSTSRRGPARCAASRGRSDLRRAARAGQRAPRGRRLADAVHRPARRVRGDRRAVGGRRRPAARRRPCWSAAAPGIGKSRLLMEAAGTLGAAAGSASARAITRRRACTRSAACSSRRAASRRATARTPGWRSCARAGRDQGDLPLLAAALSIPAEQTAPPTEVDPTMLRVRALHVAAAGWSVAGDAAAMLLVEDLHWADESTLDLIGVLLAIPRPGLLIVLTARDDFEPPWPAGRRVELGPTAPPRSSRRWPGRSRERRLPDAQLRELVARSDGVPLFLEELARSAERRGAPELPRLARPDPRHPAALRDPLLARLALARRRPRARADRLHDRARRRPRAAAAGRRAERRDVHGEARQPAGRRPARPLGRADRPLPPRADPGRGLRDAAAQRLPRAPQPDRRPAARRRRAASPDAGVTAFHLERATRYDGGDRRPPTPPRGGPGARRPQGGDAGSSRTC